MEASIENMRQYYRPGVDAYSPATGETYSANPGDYWDAPAGWIMKDSEDTPMILATRSEVITPLTETS